MTIALCLLAILGVIGAFDTIYYHEWKARLPARGLAAAAELKLYAIRDFLYAAIFASLPWLAWHGQCVFVLTAILNNRGIHDQSDASLEVYRRLGGVWWILSLARFVPRPIRNWAYSIIARNRYRWFGRRATCRVPQPHEEM